MPTNLHQYLKREAAALGQSFSEFMTSVAEKEARRKFQEQQAVGYGAVQSMIGAMSKSDTSFQYTRLEDISSEIDEALYGDDGAWRGDLADADT